ncbi:hypothetical protein [Limnoglobus roseus]|uniref:hypothetical protein n=1 Tax=Limnoglobus roseus TaxID=2598579 RepID=UPI0011EB2088|nr:hypothetical protein [Limnoglobus roseus]
MTTNWSEEKYDAMSPAEQSAKRKPHHARTPTGPTPAQAGDRDKTNPGRVKLRSFAGRDLDMTWTIALEIMLVLLAAVSLCILAIAELNALTSGAAVACIVAVVGVSQWILWRQLFPDEIVKYTSQVRDGRA